MFKDPELEITPERVVETPEFVVIVSDAANEILRVELKEFVVRSVPEFKARGALLAPRLASVETESVPLIVTDVVPV